MVGWGIGPCDLRASRSGFSRCLGCFTSVFPLVFSMATVSRLLQPGHLHSYGQTLRLGASREELHTLEILQAIELSRVLQHGEHGAGGAFPQPVFRVRRSCTGRHSIETLGTEVYHRTSIIHIVVFH